MQLKILNSADEYAASLVAGLQNSRGFAQIIAEHSQRCDKEDDFTCIIAKQLLPASYRGNPSILAIKALAKVDDFQDASGYQTPQDQATITIIFYRKCKEAQHRRTNPFPSVTAIIKEWLQLNLPKSKRLTVPLLSIPPHFSTHPEQLTYRIKIETQTPIKITKLSKSWLISRK